MTKMTKKQKKTTSNSPTFLVQIMKVLLFFFNFKAIWVIFWPFLVFGLKNQQYVPKNGNKLSSGSDKPQFWLGFRLMIFDNIQELINC